jgi:hypothetical protein
MKFILPVVRVLNDKGFFRFLCDRWNLLYASFLMSDEIRRCECIAHIWKGIRVEVDEIMYLCCFVVWNNLRFAFAKIWFWCSVDIVVKWQRAYLLWFWDKRWELLLNVSSDWNSIYWDWRGEISNFSSLNQVVLVFKTSNVFIESKLSLKAFETTLIESINSYIVRG